MNKFTVCGLEFESIRESYPIDHWKLKIPSGEILDAGVAGIKGESRPKQRASLQYLADRIGHDRFIREFGHE